MRPEGGEKKNYNNRILSVRMQKYRHNMLQMDTSVISRYALLSSARQSLRITFPR